MKIADAPKAKCRSCGAMIAWCFTEKGKRMPVDAEPVPGGNLEEAEMEDRVPHVRVIAPPALPFSGFPTIAGAVSPPPGPLGYVSHFATCPQADQHRMTR